MPQPGDLTGPMVTGPARFNANQAWFQAFKEGQDLGPSLSSIEGNFTVLVDAVDLKNVLGQIQADCCNMHLGGSSQAVCNNCNMAHYDADGAGAIHTIRNSAISVP